MTIFIKTGLFVAGCIIYLPANAFDVAQEFSAEAVQSIPGRPSMNIKMFVSKNAVRTESMINGNTVVEIIYPKVKRRVLLNQQRKTYMEQNEQKSKAKNIKKTVASPCNGILNAICNNMGKEKINGRTAVKWEMTVHRNGRDFNSLHWLDKKYHMPLREQLHDGTVLTMKLLGKEKVNGRNTDKWELKASNPKGQKMFSQQWYDSKLKMVIRETLPGGYVRELRNIKVAKQNKKLFKIPSDYQKESIPTMNAQRRMAPTRMNTGRLR